MKTRFFSPILIGAAIVIASCTKEPANTETSATWDITVNAEVEALANDTKTHIDDTQTIIWDEAESMNLYLIAGTTASKSASKSFSGAGTGSATFTFSVTSDATAPYTIGGIYPASADTGISSNATTDKVELPSIQNATASSYDPAAYIMVAKPETFESLPTEWTASYRRATALNKITLTNLPAGVTSFEITVPEGKYLAGRRFIDLSSGISGEIYDGGGRTNKLQVLFTAALAANPTIWFTSWGVDVPQGENITITASTSTTEYSRTITADEKGISFKEGYLNLLTVNMQDATQGTVTSVSDGEYLIAGKASGSTWGIMTRNLSTASTPYFLAKQSSINSSSVTCVDFYDITDITDHVWTLKSVNGGYTLSNTTSDGTVYYTADALKSATSNDPVTLNISANDDGTYSISISGESNTLRYNYNGGSTPRFKPYASSNTSLPFVTLIPWTPDTAPRINITETEISLPSANSDGTMISGTIPYILNNYAKFEDITVSVPGDIDWLSVSAENNEITYTAESNTGEDRRTANITISVAGGNTVIISFAQVGKSGGATWTYTFTGTSDTGLSGTMNGLTEGRGLQLTGSKGNVTYTKTDYQGLVNSITLVCSNNSSKGSGTATVKVGDTALTYNGSESATISGCGTKDTEFTFTASEPVTGDIVITIKASANSVYWKSIIINK